MFRCRQEISLNHNFEAREKADFENFVPRDIFPRDKFVFGKQDTWNEHHRRKQQILFWEYLNMAAWQPSKVLRMMFHKESFL